MAGLGREWTGQNGEGHKGLTPEICPGQDPRYTGRTKLDMSELVHVSVPLRTIMADLAASLEDYQEKVGG